MIYVWIGSSESGESEMNNKFEFKITFRGKMLQILGSSWIDSRGERNSSRELPKRSN